MERRRKQAHVSRSFKSLQFKRAYDDNLPILHCTENTCKADIWLKVTTNGVPEARIPLHKAHVCENIDFFDRMMSNPVFREAHQQEIPFESPYSAQTICDYLGSIYSQVLNLSDKNCIDFCCLAEFLNDESGMAACKKYLPDFVDQFAILKLLQKTRCYDVVALRVIEKQQLRVNAVSIAQIALLPVETFIKVLSKEIMEPLSRSTQLEIRRSWLKQNPSDEHYERFILQKEFSSFDTSCKLEFYGDLMGAMSHDMSQKVYKHIFGEQKVKRRKLKREATDYDASMGHDDRHEYEDHDSVHSGRGTKQVVEVVDELDKYDQLMEFLHDVYRGMPVRTLIFCSRRCDCEDLAVDLVRDGWPVCMTYVGQDKYERDDVINDFVNLVPMIVTTGLACLENVPLDDIELVVNYDFPPSIEDYSRRLAIVDNGQSRIYTMMTDLDAPYGDDIIRILDETDQYVSSELDELAQSEKRRRRHF